MQFDDVHKVEKAKKRAVVNQSEARNRVELFRHLPQYVHGTQLPGLESKFFQLDPMHPSVYEVIVMHLNYPHIYGCTIEISYSKSQV
jgi:translation initiation factor eIF-2B subunit delta